MSEWKKVNLKDICSEIVDCVNKTAPVCDFETPYKMLRTSDIRNGQINREGLKCVTKEVFEKWNRRGYLQKGDIIFTREAPVGEVGWLDNPENLFLGQRLMFFRADFKKCNSRFLFYTLFFRDNKLSIIAKANGSTVNHLRVPECENIEISIPDLPTQTRIATILSRYDSLIENYQKQIKLLEEAAQRLYKEWFVDLRFPGHEKVKVVDGVPEGWERKRAIDFFTISIGKTPPRAEKQWFTDGTDGIPWVSISDMKDVSFVISTSEGLTKEACEKHNIKIVSKGSVLLSFKLTVGRVAIANTDLCTNEAIAHFIKDGENWREYTFLCLRNYNYDSLGNTSGISKAVNSTIVKNMPFLMPTDIVLDKFSSKLVPMFNTIKNLQSQIRNLKESRDRMLVKLMSGEIEV